VFPSGVRGFLVSITGVFMKPSTLSNFLYKLWFTRDDDLDMLQLLFTAIIIVTLMVVWKISMVDANDASVKIEGLVTLRWLTGLLVVTAVPKWLVPFMSNHTKNIGNQIDRKSEDSSDEVFDVHNETIR
jgi:hypothetical protein